MVNFHEQSNGNLYFRRCSLEREYEHTHTHEKKVSYIFNSAEKERICEKRNMRSKNSF